MAHFHALEQAAAELNVLSVHEGLPPGASTSENETGWQMALAKLAALVETG